MHYDAYKAEIAKLNAEWQEASEALAAVSHLHASSSEYRALQREYDLITDTLVGYQRIHYRTFQAQIAADLAPCIPAVPYIVQHPPAVDALGKQLANKLIGLGYEPISVNVGKGSPSFRLAVPVKDVMDAFGLGMKLGSGWGEVDTISYPGSVNAQVLVFLSAPVQA